MTTTNPYPDVPLPASAVPASDWGDHASTLPLWYRACKTSYGRGALADSPATASGAWMGQVQRRRTDLSSAKR
jgi:hypothetical protein